jgi:SAM-dependent methyltransferase
MLARVEERYPRYAELWRSAPARRADWEAMFSAEMTILFGADPGGLDEAVDGYAEFCTDALRAQIFFERHGRYPASTYADVAAACYHDADFMLKRYLPGMYVSHFVWPHHFAMLEYFRGLSPILGSGTKLFYEVGTGCGLYSKELLRAIPESCGMGFDISTHAASFTTRVMCAFGVDSRYRMVTQDVTASRPRELADLVVSQEVLEHLEDPQAFLRVIASLIRPDGYAYITAAVNAAHVDHIYLYRTPDDVARHIEAAGFVIIDRRAEYAYANKPLALTPCQAGFLARRRGG